jgi:hypothetical protein
MAFGDVYGFRTKTRDVVAYAETDEYLAGGDTVVDLVLVGVDSGRRTVVVADSSASALVGQAWLAQSEDGEG